MTGSASHPKHDGCFICSSHEEIDFPSEIVDAARSGNLVIFAGAGISTESPTAFPETFYEEVEARLRDEASNASFPQVMQEFEDRFGRRELVRTAFERFDYVSTFNSLHNRVTAFHQEIATISQVETLFTTNWDDFFEKETGARPFVLDEDFAFFDLPGRRVMKVHGSVSNVSTIVATLRDYEKRERDLTESIMGAKLRDYLATRTIVFVGYSLSDSDFQSIYKSVLKRMGAFRAAAFVVTPAPAREAERFGLRHLQTDGGYFAHLLKMQLEDVGAHVPDERLDRAEWMRQVLVAAHTSSQSLMEREDLFGAFTLSYQDGLLAAFGRMGRLRHTGAYSDPAVVTRTVHDYAHLVEKAIRRKSFFDAVYLEGYVNATRTLLLDNNECLMLPIVSTFKSSLYAKRGSDAHTELSDPVWLYGERASVGAFTENTSSPAEAVTWLFAESAGISARARQIGGLTAENRQIIRDMRPGLVPQHSEFFDTFD